MINNEGTIVPQAFAEPGTPEASYESFAALLPEDEGRYGVFDLNYDSGADGIRNKIIFIMWAPNTSKIRSRMVYASSKAAIRERLQGVHAEVQCTEPSEIAFESVFEKVAPKGALPK
ncbi:cofilin [Nowakowskiella sp. JEL0407]|nr:cofilin [Nowakowskiella sp. JEL0407]